MTVPGIHPINPSYCALMGYPSEDVIETWTVFPVDSNGMQRAEVSGRVRVPAGLPMGFADNDAEPWWHPKQAWVKQRLAEEFKREPTDEEIKKWWAGRNPFENWCRFEKGVCDQNYAVVGQAPVLANFWDDEPAFPAPGWKPTRSGFKHTTIIMPNGSKHHFWSYCAGNFHTYYGIAWSGRYGAKFTF